MSSERTQLLVCCWRQEVFCLVHIRGNEKLQDEEIYFSHQVFNCLGHFSCLEMQMDTVCQIEVGFPLRPVRDVHMKTEP
jgi:hypothetical protein